LVFLYQLHKEEARLFEELKSCEEEERCIKDDIAVAETDKEQIENDEDRFWRQYNRYSHDLFCLEDEYRRLVKCSAYISTCCLAALQSATH